MIIWPTPEIARHVEQLERAPPKEGLAAEPEVAMNRGRGGLRERPPKRLERRPCEQHLDTAVGSAYTAVAQVCESEPVDTGSGKNRPSLVEGLNIYKLAIGPEEAFVLSRVDGRSDEREIALATGLSDERVIGALRRLLEVGAIRYSDDAVEKTSSAPQSGTAQTPAPGRSASGTRDAIGAAPATFPAVAATVMPYDPAELDEDVELDLAKRRLILEKYNQLDSLNHYQTLGIAHDAERQAVKTAYYDLVAAIHPDKYFGKNLGRFRAKMEKCFERITQAYDVLSRQATRSEYDAYLRSQEEAANLQRALDMRVTPEELERLELELIHLAESTPSTPPQSAARSSAPPISLQNGPRSSARVLSEQERRQALANTLRRSPAATRPSMNPGSVSSARFPAADPKAAADSLRHIYEGRIQRAKQSQLSSHLKAAQDAMARNDPISACNSLRIAQQLAPDDAALCAELNVVQVRANYALAERLLEQARYEERHGNFEPASRNYARAAEARPSAELWESAARCALRAKSDMRLAAETAKKAIELCPQRADLHTLLAEIYLEAQLSASATTALERAARLSPKDDTIRELRRRLERLGN